MNLPRRVKFTPAPGLALPSESRGTMPARPFDGFLRNIPFVLLGDPKNCLFDPEDFMELDGDAEVFEPFLKARGQNLHSFGRTAAVVGLGLEENGR